MIPMPQGAQLVYLPGRIPTGLTVSNNTTAVAAIPPNGYVRTLLPAYDTLPAAPKLPIFAYTACGFKNDTIWIAAKKLDSNKCWNYNYHNGTELNKTITKIIKSYPNNRILQHLNICAIEYQCYTAQNTFKKQWEAAIPISKGCNAKCIGCLSKTNQKDIPAPQQRIDFLPSLNDILEIAVPHLKSAPLPIISFGQGCEGEPTLQGNLLEKSIKQIRKETSRGIININTNGSKPEIIERLFKAGLDSIRVSMNSSYDVWFNRYYRPNHYGLNNIKKSLLTARKINKFASINLLTMPGVTDSIKEMTKLFPFLEETKPSMIQLRNLNIDPDIYIKNVIQEEIKGVGIIELLRKFRKNLPYIYLGCFTPHAEHSAWKIWRKNQIKLSLPY